jgi:hypothetical protein
LGKEKRLLILDNNIQILYYPQVKIERNNIFPDRTKSSTYSLCPKIDVSDR